MKSWYRLDKNCSSEITKENFQEHIMVFTTDDFDLAKQIETFYRSLMPTPDLHTAP